MPKILIDFVSEKLRNEIFLLQNGDGSERKLYKSIRRAFSDIENNLTCCAKVSKKLWPKEYKKYQITNLWKYDLPNGWRMIFSVRQDDVLIIAMILEWFSHKEYEKRFNY